MKRTSPKVSIRVQEDIVLEIRKIAFKRDTTISAIFLEMWNSYKKEQSK